MVSTSSLFSRSDASTIIQLQGPDTFTTASLTTNLVCRVVFGVVAILLCIVPMKHLYRSGELAAVVFIANLIVTNAKTVIFALIWHNDDTSSWWLGQGLCDLNPYIHNISISLFVTCLLAMMRNLSQQVNLLQANPLTVREKRRRNMVQALVMFPLPLIQAAWIWPLTTQRYAVGTLVGCIWLGWPSWPMLVFFIAAPVFIAVLTAGYSILVFIRFRQIAKTTRSVLSGNPVANIRAQRVKRRLYMMVMSIMVPFLPIIIILAVLNVQHSSPLMPFDYDLIHNHDHPNPWNSILYIPSNQQEWVLRNICYSPIISALPIFLYFGMTKNAINDYRRGCLFVGLGRLFPGLHQEYDPDRDAYGSSGLSSSVTNSSNSTTKKIRSILSNRHTMASVDVEQGQSQTELVQPQPTHSSAMYDHHTGASAQLPNRNPFLFRTHINLTTSFNIFHSFFSRNKTSVTELGPPAPGPIPSNTNQPHWSSEQSCIQTRVWSNDQDHTNNKDSQKPNIHSPEPAFLHRGVAVETQVTHETSQR